MIELIKTETFANWLDGLRDKQARSRIIVRLERLAEGNAGDSAPVGEGVSELRLHFGAGYRIYYIQRGAILVVLLCGGDKSTQAKDITEAKRIALIWREENNGY